MFPGIVIGFVVAGRDGLLIGGMIAAAFAPSPSDLMGRRALGNDSAIALVLTVIRGRHHMSSARQSNYVGQARTSLLFGAGACLTVTDSDVAVDIDVALLATLRMVDVRAQPAVSRAR